MAGQSKARRRRTPRRSPPVVSGGARLLTQAERARRDAEALAEHGRALAESLDPEAVAQRTVDSVRVLLSTRNAALFRLDPASGDLVAIRVAGDAESALALPVVLPAGTGAAGLAVRERRPVKTPDVLADERIALAPAFRARVEQAGYHAVLSVPLFVGDRVVGALSVGDAARRDFTEDEARLMQAFAAGAALALENARLHAESERRRREALALAEVGRALSASLDVARVIELIVDHTCALLGTQRSGVALVEGAGEPPPIRFLAGRGLSAGFATLQPQHSRDGTTAAAIHERRPVWSADLLNDPAFALTPTTRAVVEREGYRAVLSVPLLAGDRVLGALMTYRDEAGPFTEDQVALLQTLAAQAVVALENARLYEEATRGRREAEFLAAITRAISASLDLDTVLERIAAGARDLVGSDIAAIGLREPDADTVLIRHRIGVTGSPEVFPIESGKGLGGRALATGRPQRTDDYQRDPAITRDDLDREVTADFRAALVVPIRIEDRTDGLLYVVNRTVRPFSDRDEALLARLADAAAGAIANARLFARRRESEQRLRVSEERYRTLVEGSLQGMFIHQDFQIRFANAAAARIFGLDHPRALLGRDIRQFIAPHEVPRIERYAAARLRGEPVPARFEYQALRQDGTEIWLEALPTVMAWEGRHAIQVALFDVTERHRAEEALRQSQEQLLQSQKMEAIGRLAGGVAHDFNNLLTVITGRSDLLLRRLPSEHPARRDVELIRRTADRAASLTQQLLAFSRKQVLQPKVLDLNATVEGISRMLTRVIGENIELVTALAPDLGRVHADPAQLEQVILNLVVNARDAMPEGGRLTLTTENADLDEAFVAANPGATPGPYVLLSVRDSGSGMTPEIQAHIFEPFFTTKGVGRGTGLGLSTVHGIVSQHGGYVAVQSAPWAGTTVRVYLPRVEAPAEPLEAPGPAPLAPGVETVLLVEDEPEVRDLAREVLAGAGYTVLEAPGPEEALALAGRHPGPIHLLLTDVVMPQMSGRDLAERLGTTRPGMRVLYMSGYADDAVVHRGILDPDAVLLQKPFTPDVLTRAVREVLGDAR